MWSSSSLRVHSSSRAAMAAGCNRMLAPASERSTNWPPQSIGTLFSGGSGCPSPSRATSVTLAFSAYLAPTGYLLSPRLSSNPPSPFWKERIRLNRSTGRGDADSPDPSSRQGAGWAAGFCRLPRLLPVAALAAASAPDERRFRNQHRLRGQPRPPGAYAGGEAPLCPPIGRHPALR